MKNIVFTVTVLLFSIGMAISQSDNPNKSKKNKDVRLIGLIVDKVTKTPMEFATVSILTIQDSSIVTGGLSDLDGRIELSIPPGEYIIKTEFISYQANFINIIFDGTQRQVDIGSIELSQESNFLNDIEIVSERSETSFALDKRIFTVGKDLANRGGSAEDILDNVPSITVDIEGQVSLRGSQGVKI